MAPCVDGERARQLAIALLGAKDGGRHHHERALALTSLRRQIWRCAWATPMSRNDFFIITIHTITPVGKQYKDSDYVHVSDLSLNKYNLNIYIQIKLR